MCWQSVMVNLIMFVSELAEVRNFRSSWNEITLGSLVSSLLSQVWQEVIHFGVMHFCVI